MKSEIGFSLIELMVVIAIVAVLAAVAVPSYKSYTTRAKIASVLPILEKMKNSTLEYYNKNGVWPPNLAAIGISSNTAFTTSPSGDSLISRVDLCTQALGCDGAYNAAGADYRGNFGFFVMMNQAQLSAVPSNITLPALVFNAKVTGDVVNWFCTTDSITIQSLTPIPKSLLPGGCVHPDP